MNSDKGAFVDSNIDERFERIQKEAERIEEDCTYSCKGHYNSAAMWRTAHLWLRILAIVFAVAGTVLALSENSLLVLCQ